MDNLDILLDRVHNANVPWHQDPWTGKSLEINNDYLCRMVALIHSEASEALEGIRKALPDDHLPQYPMAWVECIDIIYRTLDLLDKLGCGSPQKVFDEKMAYNLQRADHKHANRIKAGGKQF